MYYFQVFLRHSVLVLSLEGSASTKPNKQSLMTNTHNMGEYPRKRLS